MKLTKKHGRTTLATLAGLTMVVSVTATPALANGPEKAPETNGEQRTTIAENTTVQGAQVMDSCVAGTFTYDQNSITSNAEIATFFQRATQALCGATIGLTAENPLGWKLSVSGEVETAFTASVGDLAGEDSVNKVMTCTCGGNPVGGRAIITADVKGIPIDYLLTRAQVVSGANAVTFVSSDGTKTVFPLGYVIGRHAVLSYEINDEDLSASVGGNNQLWMMKTPANYFVRDVVEIVVSTESVVPAAPGATDEHPNSPNVGVLTGMQE